MLSPNHKPAIAAAGQPGAEQLLSEKDVLARWPALSKAGLKAARHAGAISWVRGKRGSAWYRPTAIETFISQELEQPCRDQSKRLFSSLTVMATGGRPEAVLQLSPSSRQRDLGLIDLNPEGRRQNKKYRATVRELPSQTKWLDQWEREDKMARAKRKTMALEYSRYACVDSIDTALHRLRTREDVNLPRFSSYSIRHRVASVLRAGKVPGEQISFQMGHRKVSSKGEARTTRNYGQVDADYLDDAATVLESWVAKVLRLTKAKTEQKRRQAA